MKEVYILEKSDMYKFLAYKMQVWALASQEIFHAIYLI